MTSQPVRDPSADHLLSPRNAALTIIDYQPVQVRSIQSMDRELMVDNMVRVARLAKAFELPIVLSTVNVETGRNEPTIPRLQAVLGDVPSYDRTSINAWEDAQTAAAIKATGRRKLVICALWTEACLTFPALDAMREGYEVYPVVDAVGGTSLVAHETALQRMALAGAKPISWVQLACELQRDWNRGATVQAFAKILFDPEVPFIAAQHRE